MPDGFFRFLQFPCLVMGIARARISGRGPEILVRREGNHPDLHMREHAPALVLLANRNKVREQGYFRQVNPLSAENNTGRTIRSRAPRTRNQGNCFSLKKYVYIIDKNDSRNLGPNFEGKYMIRCDPNDPKRCQGVGKNGQCPYRAMENSCFCERHGGNRAQEKIKKEKLRLYRLQRWENRKNEFADHQKIKSLREEIGILRMILEETLNRCQKSHDLLIYNQKISDLILKIEKIVSSANKLERALGETMDKASLLSIIDQIIQIITKYVDQEKLKLIAQEIDDRIN